MVSRSIVVLFLALIVKPSISLAQSKIDSLANLYSSIDGESIEDIELLNKVAKEHARTYPSLAEQMAKKALRLSIELDYSLGKGDAYLNLSVVNRTRSDLTSALGDGFRAYRIFEELGDSTKMGISYNSISLCYKDLGKADSSLKYLAKALIVNTKDLEARGMSLNNIGSIYLDMDAYDSAEKYYQKAIDIREEIKDFSGLGTTYSNLGILALQKENNPEKAKAFYEKSILMKKQDNDFFQLAFTYINMGNLHRNIGKYEDARKYYQIAVDYADSAEAKGVIASAYVRWARSERRAGNIELANEYDRKSSDLYIEVLEERQASKLEQLEASYNLEKKERELLINEQKVSLLEKDKKLLLIQLVAIAFIAAFIILLFLWYRTKNQKDKEIQKAKQASLESEIKHKNNELSSFTLNFIQKQEMMEQLSEIAKGLKKQDASDAVKSHVSQLNKIVSSQKRNDNEWENFRIYFEKVHSDFFKNLQAKFEGLTITDLRLAALVKMNLSVKETSSVLGISPGSVKTSRYRLRAKLGLNHDDSLLDFLNKHGGSD